ncbi:MAG: NAD-dependent epimerase [Bacteroidetes bacterium HGW-Bacteroidetes-21]|jgi:UDP-glucuronate 4-epimerase|nr:MAG: NAD-dependent epimerase [Bacteroidetes bacterium HGW-Bacteroidetes-21]
MAHQKILVTGTAGFIGFHTARYLLNRGDEVWGYDNINDYYDVTLKHARLAELGIDINHVEYGKTINSFSGNNFHFVKGNLEDEELLNKVFKEQTFDGVIHLAAQAGVRYSLTNPHAYLKSNWEGFLNILEARRHYGNGHLVFASSSSVYGLNQNYPLAVGQSVDHPISLYAASKKSNELMAHCYSYLYGFPSTGLRFFTVYGPWGRPDMALFIFTKNILEGKPIEVYNEGKMIRDFTFVDDIVEGIVRVYDNAPEGNPLWDGKDPDPSTSCAPWRVFNIGNNNPVELLSYISAIEDVLGKKAEKILLPMQPGDVAATNADVAALEKAVGYRPTTGIQEGISKFIDWYRKFYKV